jgi:hypothetical protein
MAALRKSCIFLVAVLAVTACGPVADIETFVACTEAIESRFPEAKGLSKEDFPGETLGLGETGADGSFGLGVNHEDGSPYWSCRGNSEVRTFEELTYRGVTKRPASSEHWSY